MNKMKTNPGYFIEFYRELKGLNETQYYYLVGTASNITNADGSVRIPAQQAHGLDMAYIDSLHLASATRANITTGTSGNLSYDQMKDIGVQAANLAKKIFKDELGIDIEKDDRDLAVLTSAGYVYLNGQTTEAACRVKQTREKIAGRLNSERTLLCILRRITGIFGLYFLGDIKDRKEIFLG